MMIRSELEYRQARAELHALRSGPAAGGSAREQELREAIAAWECAGRMLDGGAKAEQG